MSQKHLQRHSYELPKSEGKTQWKDEFCSSQQYTWWFCIEQAENRLIYNFSSADAWNQDHFGEYRPTEQKHAIEHSQSLLLLQTRTYTLNVKIDDGGQDQAWNFVSGFIAPESLLILHQPLY